MNFKIIKIKILKKHLYETSTPAPAHAMEPPDHAHAMEPPDHEIVTASPKNNPKSCIIITLKIKNRTFPNQTKPW